MSRPSLAPQRREEILDAFEASILEHGLEGSSLARVARRAGLQTSHVSHYMGSRAGLIEALVARLEARYTRAFRSLTGAADLSAVPPELLLRVLLSDAFNDARSGVVFRDLVALSARDAGARQALARVYAVFDRAVQAVIAAHAPELSDAERDAAAHALICIADHTALLERLGHPGARERGLAAARRVVGLPPAAGET